MMFSLSRKGVKMTKSRTLGVENAENACLAQGNGETVHAELLYNRSTLQFGRPYGKVTPPRLTRLRS